VKIFNAQQIRNWDAFTIQHTPISSIDLMERASLSCANWIINKNFQQNSFKIFCGKGNNGGDGLAVARLLLHKGFQVTAYILEFGNIGTDDFQKNLQRLHELRFSDIHFMQSEQHFPELKKDDVVIDALLGSGLNKPLAGISAELVNHINQSQSLVISIDLPSGLYIDRSSVENKVIEADHTLTFQCYKLALLVAENAKFIGEVHVLDIGLAEEFLQQEYSPYELVDDAVTNNIFKHRNRFTHKGNFGHAALVTGSTGLMGAATLCASACMRSGVGKLTCYVPRSGYEIMQIAVPEAMAKISGSGDNIETYEPVAEHEAIGIGPGIGYDIKDHVVKEVFEKTKFPMVIDADAITMLAKHSYLLEQMPQGSVLTPHPKEFEKLFGSYKNDFERIDVAQSKSKELNIVVVLKGHHTVIAAPAGKLYFNNTGNAGMATGGSGDVLTGIITALLAQKYTPEDAALLGVYIHGLAGDFAANEISEEAMIAGDIIDYLPHAFKTLATH
jgi:NAD(P)H-hydrate epimerase